MPVMGGEEAARFLHAIRQDVPILVSSGYNESEVARRFAGAAWRIRAQAVYGGDAAGAD